jgi:hypothetical protein
MHCVWTDFLYSRNMASPEGDYSFSAGGYHFGFVDADHFPEGSVTLMQLGPLGEFHHVPFSAAHGWMIIGLLFGALAAAAIWLLLRIRCSAHPTNT